MFVRMAELASPCSGGGYKKTVSGSVLPIRSFSVSLYGKALCFCLRLYGNRASVQASFLESHNAVYQCVKGVIATHAYILARIVYRTTLTNDDIAGNTCLTTENLYA